MLSESIAKLVQYGITTGLTPECERNYTTNLLLDHLEEYPLGPLVVALFGCVYNSCPVERKSHAL